VNNKDDAEFVVVDINNDEDMTNDPVLSYTSISPRATSESIAQQQKNSVVIDAEVEYYNGRQVVTVKIPIRFSKDISQKKPYYTYSIDNVKYGVATIGNENYAMVMTNLSPELDYNIGSEISIDIDKDSKFSLNDLQARLFQPFTFKGKTYKTYEVEPMGNYIILERADVPPVEVGSPAPDFNSTTIDSIDFKLSENRGKVLLLEFWATWCGPCIVEIPALKEAYTNYKDKGFEIIGIGLDDTDKIKSYAQEQGMNWKHICHKGEEIKRLYQIDGIPSSFLISSDGIILAKGAEIRGFNLSNVLAKYLK